MNTSEKFLNAIRRHRMLVETLGMDHPTTMRALTLVIELSPPELLEEMGAMAQEMGLMPEASGYLEDGTPLFRLDDIADRVGVTQEEAEKAMHRMISDREALGLSKAPVLSDPPVIHRKQ